jgi:hypothetical protein
LRLARRGRRPHSPRLPPPPPATLAGSWFFPPPSSFSHSPVRSAHSAALSPSLPPLPSLSRSVPLSLRPLHVISPFSPPPRRPVRSLPVAPFSCPLFSVAPSLAPLRPTLLHVYNFFYVYKHKIAPSLAPLRPTFSSSSALRLALRDRSLRPSLARTRAHLSVLDAAPVSPSYLTPWLCRSLTHTRKGTQAQS